MRISKLLTAFVFALTLAACTSKSVYNVNHAAIPSNQRSTLESTEAQIVKAINYKRWRVDSKAPGKIIASIEVRKHSATVEITYDEKSFSIKYLRSTMLEYDASKKTIHRNYNKWVKLLKDEIYYYLSNPNASEFAAH